LAIDQIKIQGQIHDIGAAAENVSFNRTSTGYQSNNVQDALVEVKGALTNKIRSNTTAAWDTEPTLIAEKDTVYVYTDHAIYNGEYIPAIKIGDGTSYLIDMPFVDEHTAEFYAHTGNTDIHITSAERDKWNNKVRCYVSPSDNENIIFTIN
jgi:hypothetical protein